MEFTIEFYETSSGRCPVRDFLDDLKESDPNDFAAVMAGIATKIAARDRKLHWIENVIGWEGFKHEPTNKFR